jgi:DNA-binding NtrC family response regulator
MGIKPPRQCDPMTIVDDQADARDLGMGVLMECNAEVFRAGGGNQALQLIEREPLHVVASDIDMPDVNG